MSNPAGQQPQFNKATDKTGRDDFNRVSAAAIELGDANDFS
jgi:hypothetical protein